MVLIGPFLAACVTGYRSRLTFISRCNDINWVKPYSMKEVNYGYDCVAKHGALRKLDTRMVDPLAGFPDLAIDTDSDSEMEDPTAAEPITEADIEEIAQLIKDVKQGKMGPVWKREMEAAEDLVRRRDEAIRKMPGGSDDEPKPDVNELLNERNEDVDAKLKEVFDLSNLKHPSDEEISKSVEKYKDEEDKGLLEHQDVDSPSDEAYEEYFRSISEGKLEAADLKKMVHEYYRHKGLLNEPVVKTQVGSFQLHWKQNKATFDVWFPVASQDDKDDDYEVKFLPQELTIVYKGTPVSAQLFGKVDVDGCFWCMQDIPDQGKVVGIVLRKRLPKYLSTWAHLFHCTTPNQPDAK